MIGTRASHSNFESLYFATTTAGYLVNGPANVLFRLGFGVVSFAGRIGRVDMDFVGFGQDYSYNAYNGLIDSTRVKNEFEAQCAMAFRLWQARNEEDVLGSGMSVVNPLEAT